jgi:hypothetical protein
LKQLPLPLQLQSSLGARRGEGISVQGPAGRPALDPLLESRPRAPSVSPGVDGAPVGLETPVVLSGTPGGADRSGTVAGAAAPVSPSLACLLGSHATAPAPKNVARSAVRIARR